MSDSRPAQLDEGITIEPRNVIGDIDVGGQFHVGREASRDELTAGACRSQQIEEDVLTGLKRGNRCGGLWRFPAGQPTEDRAGSQPILHGESP